MTTTDRFIAFRVFGTFLWPPVYQDAKAGTKREEIEGVVEIHYVWDEDQKKYVACVRWVSRKLLQDVVENGKLWSPFDALLKDIPNLHGKKPDDLISELSGVVSKTITYRFDDRNGKTDKGIRLRFEGGRVFDQFDVPGTDLDPTSDPVPSLRFPLQRRCSNEKSGGKQEECYSSVQIGQPDDTSLRFDLVVPTVSPIDDKQYKKDQAFFAFSALYSSRLEIGNGEKGDPLEAFMLTFGRRHESKDTNKQKYRIGSFAFARFGKPSTKYAIPEESNDLWPTSSSMLYGTLPMLGFRFKAKDGQEPEEKFSVNTDYDSKDRMLRFPSVAVNWVTGSDGKRTGGFIIRQCSAIRTGFRHRMIESGIDEAASDLRVRQQGLLPTGIQLRTPGTSDSWLDLDHTIYIVTEIAGLIKDDAVWAHEHEVAVTANIGWEENTTALGTDVTLVESKFNPAEPLRVTQLLARAIPAMRNARADLRHITPEQPQSIMPSLKLIDKASVWEKRHFGLFTGFSYQLDTDKPVAIDKGGERGKLRASYRASLQRPDVFGAVEPTKEVRLEFGAVWPSFHQQCVPKEAVRRLQLSHDPAVTEGEGNERLLCLRVEEVESNDEWTSTSMLGGLSFEQSAEVTGWILDNGDSDRNWLRIGPAPAIGIDQAGNEWFAAANIDLRLRFNLTAVEPVAVDVPRGDRDGRSQPLMFREWRPVSGSGTYILDARETMSPDGDWHLVANVIERVDMPEQSIPTLLLSHEPFAIQRFYSRPLAARGDQANVTVATYDSDTRVWQLKQVGRIYHYVQQPQSIGESMDKPRRLEIHDVETDTEGEVLPLKDGDFRRPVPTGMAGNLERLAVEFRLTPPADLWVRPSDVERNYFLPEWASREIFRQRSELGLGAALAAFRGEFVYGLAVGVTPEIERGPARRARVAEIEALTGRPVGQGQQDARDIQNRWDALRSALAKRPERLEFWADDPTSEVSFAPARFSAGARFALRTTALHRPAVAEMDPGIPNEGPRAPTQRIPDLSPRLHPLGISGGALWPIESRNVLNMILDAPTSSGGSIERIALSPLGGDADQTAKFRNGLVAIISETRCGYVQRQKVEVIGRIAVFWHRAKHVVVYERTVNPSAQFTPTGGLGTRTRRPVLRKISEYIEILEPERRYPDMPLAGTHTSSFLRALRFNNRIIPVDSAWAEDVGDIGWMVPLWNRHAARQRPQVYPRPDIAFITAAEGEAEEPESAQECLNPDNLYFFTDTTPGLTDQTDTWAVRKAIDYTDLPPPCHNWPRTNLNTASQEAASDTVAENARRVPPGYARFTWRLAPPAQRTTINAGRADKPVYAVLETLTFMRAGRASDGDASGHYLAKLLPQVAGFKPNHIEMFQGIWAKGEGLDKVTASSLNNLANALAGAVTGLPTTLPDSDADRQAIRAKIEALGTAGSAILNENGKEIKDCLSTIAANYKLDFLTRFPDSASGLASLDKDIPKYCDTMFLNLSASIDAKRLAMVQEIRTWEADFVATLNMYVDQTPPFLVSETTFRDFLTDELVKLVVPVFAATTAEVGKLRRGIETARSAVADAKAEIETCLQEAIGNLETLRRSIDQDKPWSETRLKQFETQLGMVFTRAAKNSESAIDDAKRRLSTELDDLSQRVGALTARALEAVKFHEAKLDVSRKSIVESFATEFDALKKNIEEYAAKAGPAFAKAREALAKANEEKPNLAEKIQAASNLVNFIETSLNGAAAHCDTVKGGLERGEIQFSGQVKHAAVVISEVVGTSGSEVEKYLERLDTELAEISADLRAAIKVSIEALRAPVTPIARELVRTVMIGGSWIDPVIDRAISEVRNAAKSLATAIDGVFDVVEDAADHSLGLVSEFENQLAPEPLVKTLVEAVMGDTRITAATNRLGAGLFGHVITPDDIPVLQTLVTGIVDEIETVFKSTDTLIARLKVPIEDACQALAGGIQDVRSYLAGVAENILQPLQDQLRTYQTDLLGSINDALNDAEKYAELMKKLSHFDKDVRAIGNDLARTREMAEAYGERVVDAIGRVGEGGVLAAPNNILKALAAVGSAPELPNLDYAKDRIAYYYGLVDDLVDTTPVEAWFGRLGDDLKALGLSWPFDKIGDRLLPVDLSSFDIGRVFRNFGGLRLDRLFKGYKLPPGARDAIRVSHDFDKGSFRAWVQIDVDVPLDGRRSLFSVGPFNLDVVDARLVGFVRLEASKDTDKVEQTGSATLRTDFDAVVGGQSMVRLREVAVRYEKSSGLKVDFDPKKLKLNPVFQFVQNTLQSIVGEEIGGMKIVKHDGIPVGIEHLFALPPMSLVFGTSGVQNIHITNQFQLLAYPDFVIANRFSLAKPDLPFIFTVFIIGGTGWLTIDTEYRPFENQLLVVAEAGAGGAASLGFAFAGCTGSVAITVSVALAYRKLIGQPGGGLTVSMVVLIVGVVDVLRIATAYIAVILRLSYRDNGDIHALGAFRVTIRISRFFKISTGGQARYQMRGGQKAESSSATSSVGVTERNFARAQKLINGQKRWRQ